MLGLLTIMVMARAMRMYRMVATDKDPRMAIGRSLLGFLACAEQQNPHNSASLSLLYCTANKSTGRTVLVCRAWKTQYMIYS